MELPQASSTAPSSLDILSTTPDAPGFVKQVPKDEKKKKDKDSKKKDKDDKKKQDKKKKDEAKKEVKDNGSRTRVGTRGSVRGTSLVLMVRQATGDGAQMTLPTSDTSPIDPTWILQAKKDEKKKKEKDDKKKHDKKKGDKKKDDKKKKEDGKKKDKDSLEAYSRTTPVATTATRGTKPTGWKQMNNVAQDLPEKSSLTDVDPSSWVHRARKDGNKKKAKDDKEKNEDERTKMRDGLESFSRRARVASSTTRGPKGHKMNLLQDEVVDLPNSASPDENPSAGGNQANKDDKKKKKEKDKKKDKDKNKEKDDKKKKDKKKQGGENKNQDTNTRTTSRSWASGAAADSIHVCNCSGVVNDQLDVDAKSTNGMDGMTRESGIPVRAST